MLVPLKKMLLDENEMKIRKTIFKVTHLFGTMWDGPPHTIKCLRNCMK